MIPAMARFFNTAGPCRPEDHYMLPPERRLPGVRELLERKQYFAIHAPRQSGKTTIVQDLAGKLNEEGSYAAVCATCERGQTAREDVDRGVRAVLRAIEGQAARLPEELRPEPLEQVETIEAESRLAVYLERWSRRCALPVVLFLDEIDALLDDALLSVLRQLRSGYPDRPGAFPQSVALIGLRDVRDYRTRVRPEAILGTATPFNITVKSFGLRNFTAKEIAELYEQHSADTGQVFTAEAKALAWELTRGQPWLVNAVARQAVDALVRDRTLPVEAHHIEKAKEILIERRDTHIDSLVDRLREPRVQRVLESLVSGGFFPPGVLDDDIQFVEDLGLVAPGLTGLEIANPIYREIITQALTAVLQEALLLPHRAGP